MNEKKVLLVIFLLAMVLRVSGNVVKEKVFFRKPFLFFSGAYDKNLDGPDEIWYDQAARGFLKGKGVVSLEDSRESFVDILTRLDNRKVEGGYYVHRLIPPLYPLFLALCYWLGGINTLAYFIPQVILGALTCIFVYFLAKEIFNKKIAALAGFMVAFYPDLIFWTYNIRTETLFICLLTLGFWLLVKGNFSNNLFWIFMSGIVFGFVCLTRITFIPFIPIIFFWELFFFKKHKGNNFMGTCLVVLMIFLILFPWCMRNFIVFNKFTPFTDEIGILLHRVEVENGPEALAAYQSHNSITKTILFVKNNLKDYLGSSLRRFLVFWSLYTAPMKDLAKIYKSLTWLILFPLAFWGMIISRRIWQKSGLLIVFIFYHSLLHAASYVDSGLVYRYPIQPFLCVFAAYGFFDFLKKAKGNKIGKN